MWTYPLAPRSSLSREAIDAAIACLEAGQFTMGEQVAAFEREFAAWVGVPHAVMVNSGSSANLLAVEALMRPSRGEPRWKPGDEVLVPALAWPTTVWPLIQLGLIPVFVDIDPVTLGMDWTHAQQMLSARTVGVFLIHVLGCPHPGGGAFCRQHGLTLLEDCCESLGAFIHGHSVGTEGTFGTFSTYFSHHLPTIEGGFVVTSNDELADDLRSMRSHGWIRDRRDLSHWLGDWDPRFRFVTTGYNVRPLELEAAIGRVMLRSLPARLMERRETGRALATALGETPSDVSWMHYPVRLLRRAREISADFEAAGIETRPLIAGNLLDHPVMQRQSYRIEGQYRQTATATRRGFMMGCWGEPETAVRCIEQALSVHA